MRRFYCSKSESNSMRYGAKSCATKSPKDLHSSTVAKASLENKCSPNLRNTYLAIENCILRNQIKGRGQLNDGGRQVLAESGQKLGKQALEEVATMAKPGTILTWHRKFVTQEGGRLKVA